MHTTAILAATLLSILLLPPTPLNAETVAHNLPPKMVVGSLVDLPKPDQAFLLNPLKFDPDWPPEVTNWKFETHGTYSHDFTLFRAPGVPDELGIFTYPKNMRCIIRGVKQRSTHNLGERPINWLGKAMSWRLNDSRDLVAMLNFTTTMPAASKDSGPAACVAIYSINERNRMVASMSVPMTEKTTKLRLAKHTSYNRLNIIWEGHKQKRGFTIPDHMPLRVVIGVAAYGKGEPVDARVEIAPCGQLGELP